jgi:transcriptional accessory protein Tex/SPT6
MEETKNKVKFYADCPDGTNNKLFVYKNIKSLKHAKDILIKYIRKGYNIRSSYYEFLTNNGTMMNVKLNGISEIDFVEYETYTEKKINMTF